MNGGFGVNCPVSANTAAAPYGQNARPSQDTIVYQYFGKWWQFSTACDFIREAWAQTPLQGDPAWIYEALKSTLRPKLMAYATPPHSAVEAGESVV